MNAESSWHEVAAAVADDLPEEARTALAPLLDDPAWAPWARVVEAAVGWRAPLPEAAREALARDAAAGGPQGAQAAHWLPWVVSAQTFQDDSGYLPTLRDVALRHGLPVGALWLSSTELLPFDFGSGELLDDPLWLSDDAYPSLVDVARRRNSFLAVPDALAPGGAWWAQPHRPEARAVARRLAWDGPVVEQVVLAQRAGDPAGVDAALTDAFAALGTEDVPSWVWAVRGEVDRIPPADEEFSAWVRWYRAPPERRVPELVADLPRSARLRLASELEATDPGSAEALRALPGAWRPPTPAPGEALVAAWGRRDRTALAAAEDAIRVAPDRAELGWAWWIVADAARADGRSAAARRALRAGLRLDADPWRPALAWARWEDDPRAEWLWAAWRVARDRVDPALAIEAADRSRDPAAAGIVARSLARRPDAAHHAAWIDAHRDDPLPDPESRRAVAGFHDTEWSTLHCELVPRPWDVWVAVGPGPRPWVVAVSSRGPGPARALEACVRGAIHRGDDVPVTVSLSDDGLGWAAPTDPSVPTAYGACLAAAGAADGLDEWRVHVIRPR